MPMVPVAAQKYMALLREAIELHPREADLRADLAYLENRYRGQPLEPLSSTRSADLAARLPPFRSA